MRAVILASLVLAGCATNSGVVPIGQGTYFIEKQAATGFSGMGTLKSEVLQEAGRHCAASNKDMQVISMTEAQPPFIFGNYPKADIQFKCVAR